MGLGVGVINTAEIIVDGNTLTGNGSSGVFVLGSDDVSVTGNVIDGNDSAGMEHRGRARRDSEEVAN